MDGDFVILVDDDGAHFVYDDELASVFDGEALHTRRASLVEPFGQGWTADMRPSGGPILFDTHTDHPLGREAFKTRAEALAAEYPPY